MSGGGPLRFRGLAETVAEAVFLSRTGIPALSAVRPNWLAVKVDQS